MVCGTLSRHRHYGVWDTVTPRTSWYVGTLSRHGQHGVWNTVTSQTWCVGHCHPTLTMVCGDTVTPQTACLCSLWDTVTPQTSWCVGHCHTTDIMFVQFLGHCHATDIMVCGTLSHHRQHVCAVCGTLSRHRQGHEREKAPALNLIPSERWYTTPTGPSRDEEGEGTQSKHSTPPQQRHKYVSHAGCYTKPDWLATSGF